MAEEKPEPRMAVKSGTGSVYILPRILESIKGMRKRPYRNNNDIPPKIHNLVRLSELAKIKPDEKHKFLLDKINDFNIQTRYPDYKLEFYKRCTKDFTKKYFDIIKEFYKWFNSLLK